MKKTIFLLFFATTIPFAFAEYNKGIVVETVLKTDTNTIGQKISYPKGADNEVTIAKITIPPGKSTGWHKHHFPVFAYVLKGKLTVKLKNNKTLIFKENSSFAEVVNVMHSGENNEKEDLVLIAFYLGEKGKPLSIKE